MEIGDKVMYNAPTSVLKTKEVIATVCELPTDENEMHNVGIAYTVDYKPEDDGYGPANIEVFRYVNKLELSSPV